MQIRQSTRRGFTLVELLVVIAIIGALVGLLLPAVQAARESARMSTCRNNLKQFGLALHNFHDVRGQLPLGVYSGESAYDDDGYSWGTALLPYLEQQPLYDQINPDFEPGIFTITYRDTRDIVRGGEISLDVFRCPSSQLDSHVSDGVPANIGYATSDYKACNGFGDDGMFYKVSDGIRSGNTIVRFADVTDGLSQTIAVGESAYYRERGDWPIWIGAPRTDEAVLFKTQLPSVINCGMAPKSLDRFRFAVDDDCAFSWHDGGALFTFADGSVHFIQETIDWDTYTYLGTKDEGQIIEEF